MKSILFVAIAASTLTGSLAHADEPLPEHQLSFNAAVTSDYRYRGITQTRSDPALQGGIDYTHTPTGLYAGAWASTIRWTRDAGGSGDVELDLYAGKRGEITDAITYDVGVLTYIYPSNGLNAVSGLTNANTTELYGQLGYGPVSIKYSQSVTDLFGAVDSKNSGYLDLSANPNVMDDLVLNLHIGRQMVKNNAAASYNDWKIGLTRDFGIFSGAVAVIGTDANRQLYASPADRKFMGRTSVIASISKTF